MPSLVPDGHGPNDQKAQAYREGEARQQQPPAASAVVGASAANASIEKPPTTQQQSRYPIVRFMTWLLATLDRYANLLIMVFTGLLFWIAYLQNRLEAQLAADTGDALKIAKQSADAATAGAAATQLLADNAKKSADAAADGAAATKRLASSAKQSANAARDAVRITEDTARLRLRAYVSVTGVAVESLPDAPERDRVIADMKNGGTTPALDVESYIMGHLGPGDVPQETWLVYGASSGLKSILGAGDSSPFFRGVTRPKNTTVAGECLKGQTFMIFGYVRYRDVFGKAYETRFCAYMNRETAKTGGGFVHASFGNEMIDR